MVRTILKRSWILVAVLKSPWIRLGLDFRLYRIYLINAAAFIQGRHSFQNQIS